MAGKERSLKSFLPFVIGLIVFVGIVGGGFFYLKNQTQNLRSFKINNIVYKRIYFDKFVIARNIYPAKDEDRVSRYLSKAWVFYIKGFVDVEFPLKDFKIEGNTFIYKGGFKYNGEILPYVLTITVPAENFYDVYEIKPQPISEEDAESIGRMVGAVVAPVGGYLGVKGGGSLGNVVCNFIPQAARFKAICGVVGSVVGGAVGGAGTYLTVSHLTYKLVNGFRFVDELTVEEKNRLLEEAKKLILLDIAADSDLQRELKKAFENYVRSYFSRYGIEISKVVYETSGNINNGGN
jgi:hypothetical protein